MKILSQSPFFAVAQNQKTAGAQPGTKGAEIEGKSVKVALSSASRSLTGTGNDVDVSKVAQIRAAIKDGSLQINPDRIAQGLIDSAMELLR